MKETEVEAFVVYDGDVRVGAVARVIGLDDAMVATLAVGEAPDIAVPGITIDVRPDGTAAVWFFDWSACVGEKRTFRIRDNRRGRWATIEGAYIVAFDANAYALSVDAVLAEDDAVTTTRDS